MVALISLTGTLGQPNLLQLTQVAVAQSNPLVLYTSTFGAYGAATVTLAAIWYTSADRTAVLLPATALTYGLFNPSNPGTPTPTAGAWFLWLPPACFLYPNPGSTVAQQSYGEVSLSDTGDSRTTGGIVIARIPTPAI